MSRNRRWPWLAAWRCSPRRSRRCSPPRHSHRRSGRQRRPRHRLLAGRRRRLRPTSCCRPASSTSSTTPIGSRSPFRRRGRTSPRPPADIDGSAVPTISAATDLGVFADSFDAPGVRYGAFPFTPDAQTLLDRYGYPGGCDGESVVPYADGVFTGLWGQWTGCGATGQSTRHLIVGSPADNAFTAVVGVQLTGPQDQEAFDVVVDTFNVTPAATWPVSGPSSTSTTSAQLVNRARTDRTRPDRVGTDVHRSAGNRGEHRRRHELPHRHGAGELERSERCQRAARRWQRSPHDHRRPGHSSIPRLVRRPRRACAGVAGHHRPGRPAATLRVPALVHRCRHHAIRRRSLHRAAPGVAQLRRDQRRESSMSRRGRSTARTRSSSRSSRPRLTM